MGTCTRCTQNAHQLMCELFDPDTPDARAAQIKASIASCPECRARLESELAVRGLVRECCGRAQAPEPLRQRIITSITTVSYREVRFR